MNMIGNYKGHMKKVKEPKQYYSVRFPLWLKDILAQMAAEQNRSMNNFIIHILTDHVNKQK